ncbi:hypothetical protein BH11MYX1_BH11MYX1_01970 [soil metagenome]
MIRLQAPLIAYSAQHNLFAIVREVPLGDGDFDRDDRKKRDVELVIFDIRATIVTTLSLLPPEIREQPWTYDDLHPVAGAITKRIAAANRVLRDLGFDPVPGAELAPVKQKPSGSSVAVFPNAKLGVAERGCTARLLDHDRTLGEHRTFGGCDDKPQAFTNEYPPTWQWAAWLPGRRIVLLAWHTSGAEHSDRQSVLEVWQVH